MADGADRTVTGRQRARMPPAGRWSGHRCIPAQWPPKVRRVGGCSSARSRHPAGALPGLKRAKPHVYSDAQIDALLAAALALLPEGGLRRGPTTHCSD